MLEILLAYGILTKIVKATRMVYENTSAMVMTPEETQMNSPG